MNNNYIEVVYPTQQFLYQESTGTIRRFRHGHSPNYSGLLVKFKTEYTNPTSIIVISRCTDITKLSSIIVHLTTYKIQKIIFVIEDVFRFISPYSSNWLDSYVLERWPEETRTGELDVIQYILSNYQAEYEVYHCEYNAQILAEKYKIEIKYYDCFLASIPVNMKCVIDINYEFQYKVCCFNLRREIFRYCIASLLYGTPDLLLSIGYHYEIDDIINNQELPLENFHQDISNKILENGSRMNASDDSFWDIKFEKFCDNTVSSSTQSENIIAVSDSFLKLVTETRFCSPMPYFSEKTLKPMAVFRPFILLAPPGTLSLMKKLGFKTFDSWWDESYDDITDHNLRLETVYHLVSLILKKDKDELSQILVEMTDVLIYNKKHILKFEPKMFEIN